MMKKTIVFNLIICILTIGFSSCSSTPENKAKRLIKDYVTTHAHNPKSYEPVEFGKLDSVYSSYEETEHAKQIIKDIDNCNEQSHEHVNQSNNYLSQANIYFGILSQATIWHYYMDKAKEELNSSEEVLQTSNSLLIKYKREQNEFKPQFIGYKLKHSMRAQGALGNVNLQNIIFYFDSALTVVTHIEE